MMFSSLGHFPLVIALHDEILIEESECLSRRGSGQADQVGIEVFQDLTPQVVDRAMVFVGENDIELPDRDPGVVGDW